MLTFGRILKIIGWLLTLGPIAVIAFTALFVLGGSRPTELQFAQGFLAIVYAGIALPAGVVALALGYVIVWSRTESKLGRRWFP